ncbi:MAG: S-layer homology domain-containing protein [Thermoleophilia bacterium]
MAEKSGSLRAGFVSVVVLFLAVVGALIWVPHVAASVQWTVEKIHTEATDEIEQVEVQGDHLAWTTYSRVDGSINLWAYTISTKQKQHLAGPGLAAHIDDEVFALDGDHIAWVEYLPGGDTSSIVLYEFGASGTRRLRGSTDDMTWDLAPFIQGDWLVWEGGLVDDRPYWAVDPVVFAYRISTSGPIKVVRRRDTVTAPYGDEYRSMDNSPVVFDGKLAWRFTRPSGNFFSGTGGGVAIMDLNTKVVDWSWDVPDGRRLGSYSLWSGNLLFTLYTPYDAPPFQSSLWLRPDGATQPIAVQTPSAAMITMAAMKNGLMAWTSGSNVLSRKIADATVQVATDGAALAADGAHLAWQAGGMVWWRDVDAGQSMSISGSAGGSSPVVDGSHVVWKGDRASGGDRYYAVYLATQGQGADFPDVPATHPYAPAVYGMAARGIISGYGSGLFGLNDPVKRAQFAKMICGTMAIPVTEATWLDATRPFTDLGADDPASLYPHDYVAAAAANNITKGVTPGNFEPYTSITRAQVITMIVRAAENLSPTTLTSPAPGYNPSIPNFSDTHWPNLRKAEANGLLAGLQDYGSSWDPWQTATRSEVAQMLWNLLGRM